jgi:hypothetical protein
MNSQSSKSSYKWAKVTDLPLRRIIMTKINYNHKTVQTLKCYTESRVAFMFVYLMMTYQLKNIHIVEIGVRMILNDELGRM